MELFIPKDAFNNYRPPVMYLCTTGGKRMQELPYYDGSLNAKWAAYSELSFSIDRTYIDVLTGETKIHPAFDKAESLRKVEVENIGLFILQDMDDAYNNKDSKSLSAFSAEYECGNKFMENFRINTGEEDSREVMYLSTIYGDRYTLDSNNLYKVASGDYDPYKSYYVMEYTKNKTYEYVQTEMDQSTYTDYLNKHGLSITQPHEKLYVKNYPNVQFYNKNTPELSLLHIVLEYIPGWTIKDVDVSLWRKERKFEEDRIDVYSFLTQNIVDTFNCVVAWDTLNKTISFYEEEDDGLTADNTIVGRWNTDVYVSKENLASEIQIKVSGDNIKTQLKVSGGEDLNISEANLGKNYLLNLDYYHNEDWMDRDVLEQYDKYLAAVKYYTPIYKEKVQGWLDAQSAYHAMMYNIAVKDNIVLVGDVFKKLYCVYEPYDTALLPNIVIKDAGYTDGVSTVPDLYSATDVIIDKSELTDEQVFVVQGYRFEYDQTNTNFIFNGSMMPYNRTALLKTLYMYDVDSDIKGENNDNILLVLTNKYSDRITIRIYDPHSTIDTYQDGLYYYVKNTDGTFTNVEIKDASAFAEYSELYTNDYKIKWARVNSSDGISQDEVVYDLSEWLRGDITDEKMGIKDDESTTDIDESFTVASIGTMGAYLVLAKDEKSQSTIEEYGINQLQEKYDAYQQVFLTQTEKMFSQEGKKCIAQDNEPIGNYAIGTRWLDTNSRPAVLMEYVEATTAEEMAKDKNGDGKYWKPINATDDEALTDAKNYARYIDNYEKMTAIQNMLVHKKAEAEYWWGGYEIPNRRIVYETGDSDILFYSAADAFFRTAADGKDKAIISNGTLHLDYDIPIFTFTHHSAQQSYTAVDVGAVAYHADMNYYKKIITVYDQDTYKPATGISTKTIDIETYVQANVTAETYSTYDGTTTDKTLYILAKDNLFAIYLQGTKPYVAYKQSAGVYQAMQNAISKKTDFESFFDEDQWARLSPLIREDVFEDSNFFFTSYESKEEEFKIYEELIDAATKELKTLSQPSFEFSMTMANILALPEFAPIISQFELGKFIRIELRPGLIKRSRLLECNINFDDFSDLSCTFGNLITTKSEIDLHADLLKQAVSAGKQVAASKGSWQSAVDKSNKLEQDIANGLQDVALRVSASSGQAISWDSSGMHFRKYKDGSTTEFEPEEMAIINNALVATNDSWVTSKAAFGKYTINGEDRWGPIAEYVTADTIEGKYISGGSIQIGDENLEGGSLFKVNEKGEVSIIQNGVEKYASKSAMQVIDDAYRYRVEISYDKSTVFANSTDESTLTCTIYDSRLKKDVTSDFITKGAKFSWIRISSGDDTQWNDNDEHKDQTTNTITIKRGDVDKNAQFSCQIKIDEAQLPSDETQQS